MPDFLGQGGSLSQDELEWSYLYRPTTRHYRIGLWQVHVVIRTNTTKNITFPRMRAIKITSVYIGNKSHKTVGLSPPAWPQEAYQPQCYSLNPTVRGGTGHSATFPLWEPLLGPPRSSSLRASLGTPSPILVRASLGTPSPILVRASLGTPPPS